MPSIEKDFETVRECVLGVYGKDPHAALDRIEGYIEQCADFQHAAEKERDEVWAEKELLYRESNAEISRLTYERDALKAALEAIRDRTIEPPGSHKLAAALALARLAYDQGLRAEVERLRGENANPVDQHNRESHGTASHEAMAYDAVVKERDALKRDRDAYEAQMNRNADHIDALKAENERIAGERDRREAKVYELGDEVDRLQAERDALKAKVRELEKQHRERDAISYERDALKAALVEIAEVWSCAPLGADIRYVTADTYASKGLRMHAIARQALRPRQWGYGRKA